ncbi:MAG: GntR family transcriptional regulator [Alphaproteobacteria bacterium]
MADRHGIDVPARTQGARPTYQRIHEVVLQRIATGEYAVGERMPTDEMLMSEFGVSRFTARAAVQLLVDDQVVRRFPGRGSFVVAPPDAVGQWACTSLEDVIDRSFPDRLRVIEAGPVAQADDPDAAVALGLETDAGMHRVLALREHDGAPYTCSMVFMPDEVARRLPADLLTGSVPGQIIRHIEQYTRSTVLKARQVANSVGADRTIARLLQVAVGTPLLVLERTYFTRTGRALEHARIFCRPDRYRQTIEFHRRRERRP